jgi:hypothetical protein
MISQIPTDNRRIGDKRVIRHKPLYCLRVPTLRSLSENDNFHDEYWTGKICIQQVDNETGLDAISLITAAEPSNFHVDETTARETLKQILMKLRKAESVMKQHEIIYKLDSRYRMTYEQCVENNPKKLGKWLLNYDFYNIKLVQVDCTLTIGWRTIK